MKNYQIGLLSFAVCLLTVFVQGDLMVSQVTSVEEEEALAETTKQLNERSESVESAMDSLMSALEIMEESHAEVLQDMSKMLEALDQHLGPSLIDLSNAFNIVNRGMIGVEFGDVTDDGIVIEDVFEGFPAQESGVEAGDVLVELDGVTVKDFNDPISSVVALLGNKVPGSEANLTFLRDGTKMEKTIELVSRARLRASDWRAPSLDIYPMPTPIGGGISIGNWPPRSNNAFVIRANKSIGIMEMEEDLGHYFGVEYGVLILTIPEVDDFISYDPQLEVGDVILEIDGKSIRSASHVYKHTKDLIGEFEVVVKRKKREKTLTVDAEELRFRPVLGIN
ncbi:MAG: PDZ domain-containing protein [Gammaproteobacteria bacterium]|nr:PDZ domain-containing protein [Gammaproteobacteria bacterium]